MPYMGSSITPSEELRAGMLDAPKTPCSICNKPCWGECDNCYAPMCDECSVKCAGCKSDNSYCLSCSTRMGYVETAGVYRCENCHNTFAAELEEESMLEEARR